MPEVTYPIKQIAVHYFCDVCGKGEMETTQIIEMSDIDTSSISMILHRCNHCGHEQSFNENYPCLRYVELGDHDIKN